MRVRGRRHRGRRRDPRPPLSWRRRRSRCAASTTTWPSSRRPRSCSTRRAAQEIILADAKNLAFAQGYELIEDAGPAGRGRRAGRMAGGADGLVRRGVPRDPARGDPHHHPQQPEMLRAARSAQRQARQQVHPRRQHRGRGRRQGDRRRQRARHPRAAVRCQILLRDRPQDTARRPAAEVRADRVSREARHAVRSASSASSSSQRELAPSRRRRRREGRSAPRDSPRPTC